MGLSIRFDVVASMEVSTRWPTPKGHHFKQKIHQFRYKVRRF